MVKQMSAAAIHPPHNHHNTLSSNDKLYHRIDTALHNTNPFNAVHKPITKASKSPLAKMFNRFVQSIAQANDSGTFDVSLEIKNIQTESGKSVAHDTRKTKTMCHVRHELEKKKDEADGSSSLFSTPKCSPYLYRKAKAVCQSFRRSNGSSRETSPRLVKTNDIECDDNNASANGEFQRTHSQRSSSRSAKLLQFFSNKKYLKSNTDAKNSSGSSSDADSPILLRAQLNECQALNCSDHKKEPTDLLDGDIDSLNSSFEMQSPLLPTFKITPAKIVASRSTRCSTSELTQFIRDSFHAKRAYVTRLRRSLSATDDLQNIDYGVQGSPTPTSVLHSKKCCSAAIRERSAPTNMTNCVNDRVTILRKSDSSGNISPFCGGLRQSPLQTSPSHCAQNSSQGNSTALNRSASMTTTATRTVGNAVVDNGLRYYIKNESQLENGLLGSTRPSKGDANGALSWATSLESLLADIAGLKTFAAFLKLEYSAENIYFWAACERFHHLDNKLERAAQAKAIYNKHLSDSASEPVNVDSKARNLTENQLNNAQRDIFVQAQKQIFNLMKFDSYPRFIRSDLYKNCLQAYEKGQPLPASEDDSSLNELLKISNSISTPSKLKKSASNAEDRRRKSLLPWHRKTRSKSRERIEDVKAHPSNTLPSKIPMAAGSSVKVLPTLRHNSVSTVYDSRSSLTSFDALPIISLDAACCLCRIKFTDGATTMVQTKPSETIGQLVERLLEKRGIRYRFYDAIVKENNKSIDLSASTQEIAGKEVEIEQRIAFKLDLPDPKVISVKSKPKKQLHDVVRPILTKYNYDMNAVEVLQRDTQTKVDLSQSVTVVDGQRLQVKLRSALMEDYQNEGISKKFKASAMGKNAPYPATVISQQAATVVAARKVLLSATTKSLSSTPRPKLINGIFNDNLQKSPRTSEADSTSKSDDCDSEASSVFEKTNNIPSLVFKPKKKPTSSSLINKAAEGQQQPSTINTSHKKPIIAKLKAGVKVQLTEHVSSESQDGVLEGSKKAPLARMEDPRITDPNDDSVDITKNQESISACLRKARNNLVPVNNRNPSAVGVNADSIVGSLERHKSKPNNKLIQSSETDTFKSPPPLPPKPKVLPIKPSNWGISQSIHLSKTPSIPTTPTTPPSN